MGVVLGLVMTAQLQAAELKIEAKLIWGTNDESFSDPKYKPVDEATAAKFKNVFKWKKYFEVTRKITTIPDRGSRRLPMSDKCVIEITELEGPNVEVTLIGEGKAINKTTHPLRKGDSFTIAGEGKDGSAWFVLITELDEK